jgi:hypothetical protein
MTTNNEEHAMNESMRHQDASAHMPLGVFLDGNLVAIVPADDLYGEATRDQAAAERGLPANRLEVLQVCHRHPTLAAVDCTVCVPLD